MKKESLKNITSSDFFNFEKTYAEESSIMKELKLECKKRFNTSEVISIIDSSIEIDGSFMLFCKEKGYTIENLQIFSLMSLNERGVDDYDPYIACGYFSIKKGDFEFCKLANSPSSYDDPNSIWSFVLMPSKDYEKYIDLKIEYYEWQKQKNGVMMSVIGGEDFVVGGHYKTNNLFFGEHKGLKSDLFDGIKFFIDNESFYKENNLSWMYSIFIQGGPGSGKTEFINTVISNYDLAPITINKYNCDDSVIELVFSMAKSVRKTCVIFENIDDLISQELVTVNTISELMSKESYNNGLLLIITSRQKLQNIKKIAFKFDKFVELPEPTYKESINSLFGDLVGKRSLSTLRKTMSEAKFNYGHLKQVRDMYIKTNINDLKNDPDKLKKSAFKKINIAIKNTLKGNSDINIKTNTKIGLLKGRE